MESKHIVKLLVGLLAVGCWALDAHADDLDSVANRLAEVGRQQVQEKIYIHTDNECYFIGDTLWYKAYVLRADDLRQSDMSRMAYVELLSPDGLVVERQCIVTGAGGYACGQFALTDSLYSGYYELRAYTRWMLNFNVSEREYTREDRFLFFNNQMCKDYYRDWDGLFSRVIPIYSKPEVAGDWDGKYMYGRPKQDIVNPGKDKLLVDFYPEGGNLVEGVKSRVAFELKDGNGERMNLEGRLDDGSQVKVLREGRGVFEYTPSGKSQRLTFKWKEKEFDFALPKARKSGVVLRVKDEKATRGGASHWKVELSHSSDMTGTSVGVAVLCRGQLVGFEKVTLGGKRQEVSLPTSLPTGVNDVQIVDAEGNTLASRLIFVNGNDRALPVSVDLGGRMDFMPYEKIGVTVTSDSQHESSDTEGATFSISVRDAQTDDPTYDDGDMLSEMLLTSDLKGFVAHPAYYFERDDAEHRAALDLLMMVQGWRRYKPVDSLRYKPEVTMTIEGSVNKMLSVPILYIDDVEKLNARPSLAEEMLQLLDGLTGATTLNESEEEAEEESVSSEEETIEPEEWEGSLGVNHKKLRKEVLVEAEITTGVESAGVVQKTQNGGRFFFQVPPFYGKAILFMKAYAEKDSLKRGMSSRKDKKVLDEESYPDYYVKRDLFYPVFSHPYDFYQIHQPEVEKKEETEEINVQSNGKLEGEHTLQTVNVEARRRGRRAIDFTKPAYVVDAYDLYNEATDRGLSWGIVNMGTFPPIACYTVYGNMNRYNSYNVRAQIGEYTFYRNYSEGEQSNVKNRGAGAVFADLHLKRIENFRFFTDYEPRNCDVRLPESVNRADITVVYETIPDDGKRYTYRDRRYILDGFAFPEDFYNPDYSQMPLPAPTDYRRTLYWNPNAKMDADGTFHVDLYNNAGETRVKVSVAGVMKDGKMLKQK